MRCFCIVAAIAGVLLDVAPARSEEMVVADPQIKVYSGPSTKFYPTSMLYAGQKVEVAPTADKQPGWQAIKPPLGSFSWIPQRSVQINPDGKTAVVIADQDVSVLAGSSLVKDAPSVERSKLKRGSLVVILDRSEVANGEVWLPIAPAAGEVRYVETAGVKALTSSPGPVPATLASMTKPPVQQTISPGNSAGAPPTGDGWRPTGPGQTMSLYNKGPAQSPSTITPAPVVPPVPPANGPQWSPYGILRKSYFQFNGQPVYVLENRAGEALLYATSQPGYSLSRYVGRTVSLYGPMDYRSNDYLRRECMTATHVAVP